MKPIQVTCSLTDKSARLPHFWEHTVGSGHGPLALRADWQRQIRRFPIFSLTQTRYGSWKETT